MGKVSFKSPLYANKGTSQHAIRGKMSEKLKNWQKFFSASDPQNIKIKHIPQLKVLWI